MFSVRMLKHRFDEEEIVKNIEKQVISGLDPCYVVLVKSNLSSLSLNYSALKWM